MRSAGHRSSPRLRAVIVVAVLAVLAAGCPPPAPTGAVVYDQACRKKLVASTPGTIVSAGVTELSGISASRTNAGVWWVHNDSGHPAHVFAVGAAGGDLGEFDLGVTSSDWEDLAVGPGPDTGVSYLYAADIGDNGHARPNVKVYRVPEPTVVAPPVTPPTLLAGVASLTLTYPNGPHDAEALIIDPVSHDLIIVTKEINGIAEVFSTSGNFANGANVQLVAAGTVALGGLNVVTGGDVTPAGDVVALRTYSAVYLFPRPSGSTLASAFGRVKCSAPTGTEPALTGEAIGFTSDGKGYVTSYEGSHPALHLFRAP